MNASRFKTDHGIDRLHDKSRAEDADEGPDAHRSAQQPARRDHHAPQQDLHDPDGDPWHALAQAHQKRVPGTAALSGAHIDPDPDRHKHKTDQHDDDPQPQVFVFREGIEVVIGLDQIAAEQRVDDGAVTDTLFHQQVDQQHEDRNRHRGHAIIHRRVVGDAHAQAVPGGEADVGKDGQVDAEGGDRQTGDDLPPLQEYFLHNLVWKSPFPALIEKTGMVIARMGQEAALDRFVLRAGFFEFPQAGPIITRTPASVIRPARRKASPGSEGALSLPI